VFAYCEWKPDNAFLTSETLWVHGTWTFPKREGGKGKEERFPAPGPLPAKIAISAIGGLIRKAWKKQGASRGEKPAIPA